MEYLWVRIFQISGKTFMKARKVLILGASSDIGIKTVEKFLNHNYDVIAHYNNNNKRLEALNKNYNSLKTFKLNLKDARTVEKFIKKKSFLKNIDIFVSLSGHLSFADFEKFQIKDFYTHLNINYLSNIIIFRSILKNMVKKKWGRVLFTSSIGTKFGGAENTYMYSLTKFLNEFFPKRFKQVTKLNILINTLQIGATNTKLIKKDRNKNLSQRVNLIPLKRMATTNEVANKIFFLSTEKNTLISGQVINISGGE